MGYAIAEELANLGAEVTLISGPTALAIQHSSINKIEVVSAAEMFKNSVEQFKNADICVMCAAVADYTPKEVSAQKIKKEDSDFDIKLKKTEDILFQLGQSKKPTQMLIGFALETNNEETFAIQKLQKKNLDFIVLNSLNDTGAGFKEETNKITIIDKNLVKTSFDLKSKAEVAKDICAKIIASL
jgi:phosphopantothenoylcysteine decarboxylase/phosphopantothenate--cysteine ligase